MSTEKNKAGTAPASMEHTVKAEALAFNRIFCNIPRLDGLSHSFPFFQHLHQLFTITSLNKFNQFEAKFYVALPDCTVFDSAWLVKYLVYQASHESWFCLCSNQWCIIARKLIKKKKDI